MRALAPLVLSASIAWAPFQCPSDPDPEKRREETPGEALYDLAQEFGKAGDREAKVRTLEYLVRKYPRSRHAVDAARELASMGIDVGDPREAAPAADPTRGATKAPSSPP